MPSRTELVERRDQLAADIERMRREFDDRDAAGADNLWPGNSEAAWQRANRDFNDVCRDIQSEQSTQGRHVIDRYIDQRGGRARQLHQAGADQQTRGMRAWARAQSGRPIAPEDQAAADALGLDVRAVELCVDLLPPHEFEQMRHHVGMESRVLSGTGATAGQTLRPEGFVASLEVAMLHFGPMLQASRILQTADGNDVPWPTGDDTDNEGEILANDNTEVAANADPTFGATIYKAWPYSSKLVRVPVTLLEDSGVDLGFELGSMLGTRLGRIINRHLTVGTGTNQPQGVVTGSVLGKAATATNAIADTELIDLQHSLDMSYRGNASWMLNDTVAAHVRRMKDLEGRFLWSAGDGGLSSGPGGLLLGRPLWVNNDMADTLEADAKPILFGDFSRYIVRRVRQVRLRRLVERFAEFDQEGFVAFLRIDGRVLNAGGDPIKHLQMDDGV